MVNENNRYQFRALLEHKTKGMQTAYSRDYLANNRQELQDLIEDFKKHVEQQGWKVVRIDKIKKSDGDPYVHYTYPISY